MLSHYYRTSARRYSKFLLILEAKPLEYYLLKCQDVNTKIMYDSGVKSVKSK
jgi:hypothetical protein